MKIAIVTDSSADLPAELVYKYDVHIIPSRIIIDGKIRYDNGVDIDTETFYDEYCNKKNLKKISTEPPSVDEIVQVYKRLCTEYDTILSIHVAGRLSNTIKNAREAVLKGSQTFKRLRLQQNNGRPFQIRIIDSQNVTLGLGLLVVRAAELRRQGISFSKLANELEKLASHIYSFFVVDDPSLLRVQRNWVKISYMDAQLAKGFSIKPIVRCNRGEITVVDRKVGFDVAIEEAMNVTIEQMHKHSSYDKVGIIFGGSESDMMKNTTVTNYRNELASMGLGSIMAVVSPTIGVYTGQKSIGFSIINGDIKIQDIMQSSGERGNAPLPSSL